MHAFIPTLSPADVFLSSSPSSSFRFLFWGNAACGSASVCSKPQFTLGLELLGEHQKLLAADFLRAPRTSFLDFSLRNCSLWTRRSQDCSR